MYVCTCITSDCITFILLTLPCLVLRVIYYVQGNQYGTDTGEDGGEGGSNADHTMFGLVRDHKHPALYWRDSHNPTFRRLRLQDIDFHNMPRQMLVLESGAYFIDMADKLVPM